jgi:hypothetical protein
MHLYSFFTEPTGNPHENLPLVFDSTEDPSINNLTRNDINCDKTGTCYDGKLLMIVYIQPVQSLYVFV